MLEPVEMKDFFIVFFSGAMIIVTGGLYALLFAMSRLQGRPGLMTAAYASYVVLVASVWTLGAAAHLRGYWWALIAAMLVGYLLAPHGVWKLCEGTHGAGVRRGSLACADRDAALSEGRKQGEC